MVLNIIFMGTPDFAVPILKSINNLNHNILEVYTQPPNKKNRGQKIKKSPIHDFSNKLLNLDKVLFINVHASLLPRWRGAAPIQRAIMNLDHETGVSIMKIVTELDAGPVLLQSKIKITKEINYKELSGQMSELGAKLILDTLKLIENKRVNFVEQNESEATYAKKIEKSEAKISWNDDAEKIIAKINAFSPNPGCWFELNGSRVKIIKAKKIISKGIPGTILGDNFTIACSKNALQIMEVKKEGKQKMTAEKFLRGNKIKTGQSLN